MTNHVDSIDDKFDRDAYISNNARKSLVRDIV